VVVLPLILNPVLVKNCGTREGERARCLLLNTAYEQKKIPPNTRERLLKGISTVYLVLITSDLLLFIQKLHFSSITKQPIVITILNHKVVAKC